MIFQDNVIKNYLKNIYFISGTPCGGKTTVSKFLGKKHNIPVYDIDELFDQHRELSSPEFQPNMNKTFKDADEFFGRSVEEYRNWLLGNSREQLDFILLDLIRMSQDKKIICDCILTLEQAKRFTDPSHTVFLVRNPENLVDDYCNRPDHQDFSNFIHSASDFESAKKKCNDTLYSLNNDNLEEIKNSEFFHVDRESGYSIEETAALVEKQFGWNVDADIRIEKVEKDSVLAAKFLDYVKNFSWEEVKEHLVWMIENWTFTDWESFFVAMDGDKIVGMVSVAKTDYYPLPEIFPWVSSVFVSEEYRGNKLSGKLIEHANAYAKSLGFTKTYIPTEYTGLYEHYGYSYVRDIENYGGGTDRLYVKEI